MFPSDILNNFCFHVQPQNSWVIWVTSVRWLKWARRFLGTCLATFVFMSRLKAHSLVIGEIGSVFVTCDMTSLRAGSQLKKLIPIFNATCSVFSLDTKTKVARHVPRININMSAWQHDMTEWHDSMTNNHKQWLLSIDMKTKVVQHVPVINISTWYMTAWHDSMTNNHKQ